VCVVCVVYAATPGVTGYGAQALAFGAHTPARGSWVATSSGFHYTAAPQEVSRDEERGDSTPQMPNGNQDGGQENVERLLKMNKRVFKVTLPTV